ncbi:Leukocyte immunoglobulin-like receptor subfamily B member 3B, partial [Lemmus lemmus]
KPILRIEPDSVVSEETTVTFLCEETTGAREYSLYKGGNQHLRHTEISQNSKDKAEFTISNIEYNDAGQYSCQYQTRDGWSGPSDFLELVVTAERTQSLQETQAVSPVQPFVKVILQCFSEQRYDRFVLTKEGLKKLPWKLDSTYKNPTRQFQAWSSMDPVTSSQQWTFRCYSFNNNSPLVWSEPSDLLELLFSGTLHKPTIKAEPGSVIAYGSAVTIWCQGTQEAEIYVLHKEGSKSPWDTQITEKPENKVNFSINSVTSQHVGQYHCYCYSSAGWSECSDTLELVVTGDYNSKPILSALPTPLVTSGGNMMLQCASLWAYKKFILTKEDQKFLSSMDSQYIHSKLQYQALFSTDHVTPDHRGTFRCYGYKYTLHLWSVPSDPLEIHISGQLPVIFSLSEKPNSTVHSGDNVTLLCQSPYTVDTFILSKEGAAHQPQQLKPKLQVWEFQAEFSMSTVTSDISGTYRCYASEDSSLYLLSYASAPVELTVSGEVIQIFLS